MTTQELIAQARGLSGENTSGSRPQFPSIKFMGRKSQYGEMGKYYLLTKNKDNPEQLDSELIGDTCKIIILRIRKMLENDEDGDQRKFVYEFDSAAPGAPIIMKIGRQEPIQLSYKEVREQHPDMKYREILYVAFNGKLCRMKVSGGSLSGLFKYLQSIPSDDTVMRYETVLGSETIPHAKGDYAAITFTRGDLTPDFEKYLNMMSTLSLPSAPSAMPALPEPTGETDVNEEIDIEDVPFN